MATFPFLSKSAVSPAKPADIALPAKPKNITSDEIAERVAPQFPHYSREELREAIRLVHDEFINTLLSGTIITTDDGGYWMLDDDGRTIVLCLPEEQLKKG